MRDFISCIDLLLYVHFDSEITRFICAVQCARFILSAFIRANFNSVVGLMHLFNEFTKRMLNVTAQEH